MKNPQLVMISDKTERGDFGITRTGWFDKEHLVEFWYHGDEDDFYLTEDVYVVTGSMIIWDISLDNE